MRVLPQRRGKQNPALCCFLSSVFCVCPLTMLVSLRDGLHFGRLCWLVVISGKRLVFRLPPTPSLSEGKDMWEEGRKGGDRFFV